MARTLIKVPASVRAGEIFEVHLTIGHDMETGYRPGDDGKTLPRNIITGFTCHYNGQLVFESTLFPSVAANPYLAFALRAGTSGTLRLRWWGDRGFEHIQDVPLTVT